VNNVTKFKEDTFPLTSSSSEIVRGAEIPYGKLHHGSFRRWLAKSASWGNL